MFSLTLPNNLEELFIKQNALISYVKRTQAERPEDEVANWYDGEYQLAKDVAEQIMLMLNNNKSGLTVSENLIKYLEEISVASYKSILDQNRFLSNWNITNEFIKNYMENYFYSSEKCSDSIKKYLIKCNQNQLSIINKKAYWLYLTSSSQEPKTNFEKAANFVDTFYNVDIIISAIEGTSDCVERIKKIIFNNQEITNMVELNIFRIKEIVAVPTYNNVTELPHN